MTNTQIIQKPSLYVAGLNLICESLTSVKILAGEARDGTNKADINLEDEIILNTGTIGINGLDQGVLAVNTFYTIFVIGDSSLTQPAATIMSVSDTPLLPSDYDVYRRIGWVKTDGASNLELFHQTGGSNTRYFRWDEYPTILAGGNDVAFTAIPALLPWVPSLTSNEIGKLELILHFIPATPSNLVHLRPSGALGAKSSNGIYSGTTVGVVSRGEVTIPMTFPNGVEYAITEVGDSLSIVLASYEFQI